MLSKWKPAPDFLLLDAALEGSLGGTGSHADWCAIERARLNRQTVDWPPLILAGGLTPKCVGEAIRTVRPAGVDVCSGVESAPGIKDPAKVSAFVRAVRSEADPAAPRV